MIIIIINYLKFCWIYYNHLIVKKVFALKDSILQENFFIQLFIITK